MKQGWCLYCGRLAGCLLLQSPRGSFIPERILGKDRTEDCADWEGCNSAQTSVREILYGISGDSALRVMHQMPAIMLGQLVERESVDEMAKDSVDLSSLLTEGITAEERKEQLLYVTDEEGHFVIEEGEEFRRPRESCHLRKYACDPEGHINLDHSVGMLWPNTKIADFIVDSEIEQGLVAKKTTAKKTITKEPPGKPAQATKQKVESSEMATGKRVMIIRGKKSDDTPAPSVGKLGRPPMRRTAPVEVENDAESDVEASAPTGDSAQMLSNLFDEVRGLQEDIKTMKGEIMQRVNDKFNELSNISETLSTKTIESVTVLHDLLSQTKGTMQYEEDGELTPVSAMLENPNLILGHLTGEG